MLKIGIMGCGTIARVRHIPEYAANENCVITAYYAAHAPEKARRLAAEYGGTVYTDPDEFLESGLDAVSICTANALHAPLAVKALEKGIHVLCEKPMAVTEKECEEMAEAAERSGSKLMIAQNQRFVPAHREAKRLLEEGTIGKILTFDTVYGHAGPEAWAGTENPSFFDPKLSAFGAMADIGVHKTDLIHYLLGEPIVKVSAMLGTFDKKYPNGTPLGVDDNAFCIYQTRSGITGTMHVSWTEYGQERNFTVIQGTEGVLRCCVDPEYAIIIERKNGEIEKRKLGIPINNEEQTSGAFFASGVIDSFVKCILEDTEEPVSGREALKAMKVIFAALESDRTGQVVTVEQS